MSRRPKRSRAEQREPVTISAAEVAKVDPIGDFMDPLAGAAGAFGSQAGCDECAEVREELLHTTTAFHCQTCGFTQAPQPRGGKIVELGAPFDEELPALPAEVLAVAGLIVEQADQIEAERLRSRLPDWWPEDASQQAMLTEALDSWGLGYNEVGGIAFREQLVVVTLGGLKLHWPADRGRQISDMHKGRPHAHTGPGRQFPGGYLRRDASRDPKE